MNRRKALITGASRGIGRAIAIEFAMAGYDLTITCHKESEQLSSLAMTLMEEYGIACNTFVGDLSQFSEVGRLFQSISDIDVLINNAGISHIGLLSDTSSDDWDTVIGTNLNSAFYCTKLALPLMVHKKSGKIINISSVWGQCGASMEVAYSTSKGGLNAFTRALAKEMAPSNIQVNAIACGMIDTDMNKCFSKEDIDEIIASIPADRMGKPEEVARLALQLCTGNSYLTGQIITLDGGWM